MNIHWIIQFKSLRSGEIYSLNIYDKNFVGSPVALNGGAEPFTTNEGSSDDIFSPIQTQSGIISVVDNGKDASGNPFDILSLLADYATDRPVTLTDSEGVVKWEGFMQPITYLGNPFEFVQTREFAVHCPLTAMADADVKTEISRVKTIAYYIVQAFASIGISSQSDSPIRISNYYIQGGIYASDWLTKMIDPTLFVEVVDDEIAPRYDMLSMMQDICGYIGLTMRMCGDNVYFDTIASKTLTTYLKLTQAEMEMMAEGQQAGTVVNIESFNVDGAQGIFATNSNELYSVNGYSRATVRSKSGQASNVLKIYSDSMQEYIIENGTSYNESGVDGNMTYAKCITSFPGEGQKSPLLSGETIAANASFCMIHILGGNDRSIVVLDTTPAIHIHVDTPVIGSVVLKTRLEHCYHDPYETPITGFNVAHDGGFRIKGDIYLNGEKYNNSDDAGLGQKTMRVALGVGHDEASAVWWNGTTWVDAPSHFIVAIGNDDDIFRYQYNQGRNWMEWIPCLDPITTGFVFLKFAGSDDAPEVDGHRSFFITNLEVEYKYRTVPGARGGQVIALADEKEYTASNRKNGWKEWNLDTILVSGNGLTYGTGIVISQDGKPAASLSYPGGDDQPEQKFADRVSSYSSSSKKRAKLHVRRDRAPEFSSLTRVILGGTAYYPNSISSNWRDDIVSLTLTEV